MERIKSFLPLLPLARDKMASQSNVPVTYNSVTIHLFEARDLPGMDRNGLSDPFCKFRLGSEKFRSRVIKKSLNPQWNEQFDIFLYEYDSKRLEVSLWDWDRTMKNELMGRVDIDLAVYEKGRTYDLWLDVKDKGIRRGSVHLSVLVNETKEINDFARQLKTQASVDPRVDEELSIAPPFTLARPHGTGGVVGSLLVKIFTLKNLPFEESIGNSLYCVLQLDSVRVQTHTIPKMKENAEWNCDYFFPVDDFHSVLEINVLERDVKSRTILLGSLAFPLSNIKNNSKRWFFLKEKKLMKLTQMSIFLEFQLEYDVFRAALQTVRPKVQVPSDLDKTVSSQVLVNKINQIRKVISLFSETLSFCHALLRWESIPQSALAYFFYVFTVFFFEPFWIPFFFLLLFLRNYIKINNKNKNKNGNKIESVAHGTTAAAHGTVKSESDEEVDSLYSSTSETSSFASSFVKFSAAEEFIQLIPSSINPTLWSKYLNWNRGRHLVTSVKTAHDQARFVQLVLEFFAEHYEKIVNVLNFTVPWLSFFAVFLLTIFLATFFFLPFRFVCFLWGTWEFGKGFCGIEGCELLAFLSRVHTKHEAKMYAEVAPPTQLTASVIG